MSDRFSAVQVDAAVQALTADPERFSHAQEVVTHAAPALQGVLGDALHAGGWFGTAHEAQVDAAVSAQDVTERRRAVRTLIAEETRLAMLVGVAVGLELAVELRRQADAAVAP